MIRKRFEVAMQSMPPISVHEPPKILRSLQAPPQQFLPPAGNAAGLFAPSSSLAPNAKPRPVHFYFNKIHQKSSKYYIHKTYKINMLCKKVFAPPVITPSRTVRMVPRTVGLQLPRAGLPLQLAPGTSGPVYSIRQPQAPA